MNSCLPLVSIVLPTQDRLAYLQEAVASVHSQTLSDWELLIVDDGSTDGSRKWLRSLEDPRIVVIEAYRCGRPAHLRNLALVRARGTWIAFLDSDDRWAGDKLERQLAYHSANPSYRWSYTGRTIIDADGRIQPDSGFEPWLPVSGTIFDDLLVHRAKIALPTVMVERRLLEEAGRFDESMIYGEDYELWLRLASSEPCGTVADPLTQVRLHEQSFSYDRIEATRSFIEIYGRVAAADPPRAVRRTCRYQRALYWVRLSHQWAGRKRYARSAIALSRALSLSPLHGAAWRVLWRRLARPFRV